MYSQDTITSSAHQLWRWPWSTTSGQCEATVHTASLVSWFWMQAYTASASSQLPWVQRMMMPRPVHLQRTTHRAVLQPFFLGLSRWASARRNLLLDFNGAREDNRHRHRHTDHPAGRHSIQTNQRPTSVTSPHFYAGCPSCCNPPTLSWLGSWDRHQWWLAYQVAW